MLKVYSYIEAVYIDRRINFEAISGFLTLDKSLRNTAIFLLSLKRLGKNGRDVINLVVEHLWSTHVPKATYLHYSALECDYMPLCIREHHKKTRAKCSSPIVHTILSNESKWKMRGFLKLADSTVARVDTLEYRKIQYPFTKEESAKMTVQEKLYQLMKRL